MSELPWVRFFPSDWLAGTRGMSAAETGIYITLIATMYERGEPVPEDHKRLARLCGASPATFKAALETLISEGKITRVEGGLWNDRVGKESDFREEKSEVGRQAANARWGKNDNKNNVRVDANALLTQSGRNANQKPYTREEANASPNKRATSALDGFDDWYRLYPHKVQRGAAERAWPKARSLAGVDELIAGLERYIASKPPDRSWQNPATWLNGKGWLDQPAAAPQARGSPPPRIDPVTEAANRLMAKMEAADAGSPAKIESDHPAPFRLSATG